jgi:3-methylcrotonyl-CoA carboxylase alpha subunit
MISKLIVHGGTRHDAVRKLAMALEDYEIAGPVTNIEFLKRICRSADFREGKVETGYIDKHRAELFVKQDVPNEVLAQAAIASFLQTAYLTTTPPTSPWLPAASAPVWSTPDSDFQNRQFCFQNADEEGGPGTVAKIYTVHLRQTSPGRFSISVPDSGFDNIQCICENDSATKSLTTFFPHTRYTSRVIFPSPSSPSQQEPFHLYTPAGTFRLMPAAPPWLTKALGVKEKANSLLSPMPCKILRVDVKSGDTVKKDQPLLVIESMKMETVIRSPSEGLVVKRVVHAEGEVVGSGVELVEFEEVEEI